MSSSDPSTDKTTDLSASVETEPKVTTPTETVKPKQQNKTKKGFPVLAVFSVILLASSGAGYYYWLQLQNTLNQLSENNKFQTEKLTTVANKLEQTRSDFYQSQKQLSELTEKFNQQTEQLEKLNSSHETLINTSQNIFDISHRDQRQWLLAEVSYLLSIANQRLLISRDIKTATAALKAANNRLHDLADPSLLKLRRKITKEIAQLNLLELPDINGIAFTLDNLSPLIAILPFKTAKQKTLDSTQQSKAIELASLDENSFFSPLWERIKTLITVKKHSRDILQTETPVEKNQIDNQIRYRIETSRLALINKNTTVFNYEIKSARELLTLYYNQNDNRVSGLLQELKPLTTINLIPELPDITGSWVLLQRSIAISNAEEKVTPSDKKNSKGISIK